MLQSCQPPHLASEVQAHSLSKRGIDTSLRGDGVRSCREQLRYAGRVEASLGETECCSQTSASGSNNDSVILVVDDGVFLRDEARCLLRPEIAGS
jgi:hypothetical protein